MHTIPIWELKFSKILYVYSFVKNPWEFLHFGVWMLIIILGQYDLGRDARKPVLGVFNKARLKPVSSATKTS